MKKIIGLGIITLTFLTSCEKKYCWKCMTVTHTRLALSGTQVRPISDTITTTTADVCDQTESEIASVEKTTASDRTEGNLIINEVATTTCNK